MSGDKPDEKTGELKSTDKKSSPKMYNFRPRKQHRQKTIDSFFPILLDRCKVAAPRTPKTPEKQTANTTTAADALESSSSTQDDLQISPSRKYESLIPKVADILKARAEEEKFKVIDAAIKESSKRFLAELNRELETPETKVDTEAPVEYKNCKHLSDAQISRKFRQNKSFIDDIFYGRVECERYEMFKRDTPLNNGTKNDLRVNDTYRAFTQDQLIHIVQLFRKRYDNGNMYKYCDFYYKVLLPEFCLKIFCDIYKMDSADALDYLKKVPVDAFL